MDRPVALRNVARYVNDVQANVPLYEALGFEMARDMGEHMAILAHGDGGLQLVLHSWEGHEGSMLDTAIGLTITGEVDEARAYLEKAGFECLREPEDDDEGYFFIYGDLDGNPVNLVGMPEKGD